MDSLSPNTSTKEMADEYDLDVITFEDLTFGRMVYRKTTWFIQDILTRNGDEKRIWTCLQDALLSHETIEKLTKKPRGREAAHSEWRRLTEAEIESIVKRLESAYNRTFGK